LDRFLLKVVIEYPTELEEIEIMKSSSASINQVKKVLSKKDIIAIHNLIDEDIFVDDKIYTYVKDIVFATRFPLNY
jgi:MoxR-like ATPase